MNFFGPPSHKEVNKAITVLLRAAKAAGGGSAYHFDAAGVVVVALGQPAVKDLMTKIDTDGKLWAAIKAKYPEVIR